MFYGRAFDLRGNNKGLNCPFKPITCQEGYCRNCQIYLDKLAAGKAPPMSKRELEGTDDSNGHDSFKIF